MLKNLFYAILLGVGMAACLSQNNNQEDSESEVPSEQTTVTIEDPAINTPAPEHFVIRKGHVGNVQIGMPVNDMRNNVAAGFTIADTTLSMEGQAYTAYNLHTPDKSKGLLIEQQCGTDCRVWRIHVKSSDYRTSKGIGVGAKYSEVQQHYPVQTITLADGGLVAVANNAGMSFILDQTQIPAAQRGNLTPSTVPANTLIKGILIY